MVKSIRFLKSQITKAFNRANSMKDYNTYSLRHFLNELEQDYAEFRAYFSSDENPDLSDKEFDEYEEKYNSAVVLFQEEVDRRLERNIGDTLNNSGNDGKMIVSLLERQQELNETIGRMAAVMPKTPESRLPALKIPRFSGNCKEWLRFKSLFRSRIDSNTALSNVEKLGHLMTLVDGEAASLIKNLPFVEASYLVAWDTLMTKYDKPYKIANSFISELTKNPQINTRQGFRVFYHLFTETLSALDSLDEYCRSRDPWIIHMVVERLDKRMRDKWAHKLATEDEPSLTLFQEFLREEDDALDSFSSNEVFDSDKHNRYNNFSGGRNVKSNSIFSASCFVCNENHKIFECEQFKKMLVKDRVDFVKSKNRCLNCFGSGHFVSKCHSRGNCSKCGQRHHTLLHMFSNHSGISDKKMTTNQGKLNDQKSDEALLKVNLSSKFAVESSILPTAIIEVLGSDNQFVKCRALLDSGSQASFITERCSKRLRLKRSKLGITFETMSSTSVLSSRGSVCSVFRSCYDKKTLHSQAFNVVSHITGILPSSYSKLVSKDLLNSKFQLADPTFDIPAGIDILLGSEFLFEIIKSQKYYHTIDRLWILESSLGWIISGGGAKETSTREVNCNFVRSSDESIEKLVRSFWELDDSHSSDDKNPDELYCEEHFKATVVRLSSGRFSVSLPFRKGGKGLGESYHFSRNRFRSLENRFRTDDWYKMEYIKLMEQFELNGYIEKIVESEAIVRNYNTFYLPHHGVGKNKSKLRIVFDASMKTDSSVSLNDILLPGPNLLPDLRTILIEFRFHKFVFVTDIVKMYRQIFMNEDSRSAQRFFWRKNEDEELSVYQIITITDGLSCSPFLALRTMNLLADEEESRFPKASKYMAKRYMDDFFIGHESLTELQDIKNQLIGIMGSACMQLGKWCANNSELLSDIPSENKLATDHREIKSDPTIKTLGIVWRFDSDVFSYAFDLKPLSKYSKRSLLSDSAKIYDPLGWITPVSAALKILFQEVCLIKLDWDDILPPELISRWIDIRNEIQMLNDVKVSRWMNVKGIKEIHGFCDASTKAYACIIYSYGLNSDGSVVSNVIMAKSRVAPIKPITIARLELCAAHLLAKSMHFVLENMKNVDAEVTCWTDSSTVLAWLASHPSRWKNFVANRCGEIHELLPTVVWKYVRSPDNPADVASRGTTPRLLMKNDLWWFGPFNLESFKMEEENTRVKTDLEMKTAISTCFSVARNDFWSSYCSSYSDFAKLIRVLVYILRFVSLSEKSGSERITNDSFQRATEFLFVRLQNDNFQGELKCLREERAVDRASPLSSLCPFLDERGILRAGGRLINAPIGYGVKFPIIVPKSPIVKLLVRYYHERYYHADRKLLIALLRQKFWLFRINSEVKYVIQNCVRCRTLKGITFAPKMGPLPSYRLKPEKPFYRTGIDFAGPVVVRPYKNRGKMLVKGYIAIMICMVSKAIHLEFVFGLDVDSLVNALKRFVARRGRCAKLFSDNGTNFVGCHNRMLALKKDILQHYNEPSLRQFLLDQLMDWEFIPPGSPHMGGLWEAGVRSVKGLLAKRFYNITPTIEEFHTALAEIESLLNSRPLFAIREDVENFEIVTPSHLICGYASTILPTHEDLSVDTCELKLSKRFSYLRSILKGFWSEWSRNYYHEYRKLFKWKTGAKEPKVNDIVLVRRNNSPPSCWPKGIIVEVYPGKDGIIRVARVKCGGTMKNEACRNLVPLVIEA